ncbi:hypothetical protein ACLB2K_056747 [Fragaria x ananassa]
MALLSSLFRKPSTVASLVVRTLGPARSFDRGFSFNSFHCFFAEEKKPSPAPEPPEYLKGGASWTVTYSDSTGYVYDFKKGKYRAFDFKGEGQKSTNCRLRKNNDDKDTDDTDDDCVEDEDEDCGIPKATKINGEYFVSPDLKEMFQYLE